MGERTTPLAPLEVPVGSGCAALARGDQLAVRAVAHRASGVPPLKASFTKDLIKSFRFRLPLHRARARGHHSRNRRSSPFQDSSGGTKVLDATICAGTDKDAIYRNLLERSGRAQPHIIQGSLHVPSSITIGDERRIRNNAVNWRAIFGARAPAHHGCKTGGIEAKLSIKDRASVGNVTQCESARVQSGPVGVFTRPARYS